MALSVGIGAGPALAETVVGMRVDESLGIDLLHVLETGADIPAALQEHGDNARLKERQGREIAARTGPHHHDPLPGGGLGTKRRRLPPFPADGHAQQKPGHLRTGVDGAAHDAHRHAPVVALPGL
jgi:hypothetical protein